jgi:hypothetical protein
LIEKTIVQKTKWKVLAPALQLTNFEQVSQSSFCSSVSSSVKKWSKSEKGQRTMKREVRIAFFEDGRRVHEPMQAASKRGKGKEQTPLDCSRIIALQTHVQP